MAWYEIGCCVPRVAPPSLGQVLGARWRQHHFLAWVSDMARILRITDEAVFSDPTSDLPVPRLGSTLSDGRIDSLAAEAALASDEPIPDHLVQLALKLARALDSET
jgi:hypothetical protein